MPLIIPPSPRPLLLWLAASAVCAAILTLEGMTLLTLWRWPSRLARLGLASLIIGALGWLLTGRILTAYQNLAGIGVCYVQGCVGFFPLVTHAVAVSLILGCLLIALTVASILAALVWSAVDGAQRQVAPTVIDAIGRFIKLAFLTFVLDVGVYWILEGAYGWIGGAFFTNPQSIGDGLGLIPLYTAAFEAIGGALALSFGAWLLWSILRHDAPQPQEQAA